MAQGLRLRASNTQGEGSVPSQRTVIPHATKKYKNKKQCSNKKKKDTQPKITLLHVEVTDLAPLTLNDHYHHLADSVFISSISSEVGHLIFLSVRFLVQTTLSRDDIVCKTFWNAPRAGRNAP